MNYTDTAKKMIASLKSDVDRYLCGEKSDYLYCEEILETYGSHDKNYINRTRLCYGLIYEVSEIRDKEMESIVRELFAEEVKSRQKESFQGIGINLVLLTVMLRKYETADSELFQEAKNANFDCYCGYNYEMELYEFTPIEELSLTDVIYLSSDMQLTEYTCKFVDIFKENITCIEEWKQLKWFSKCTERMCDRELAVKNIFGYAIQNYSRDSFDFFYAVDDYIILLTDLQEYNKAVEIFMNYADIFNEHNRAGYEKGMKLIAEYPPCRESVWEVILPFIRTDMKNIAPVNCIPLADCANIMGDKCLSRKLRKIYDVKMKDIKK